MSDFTLSECHICGARAVKLIEGFDHLRRVTSDCKPWKAAGQLGSCNRCGAIQKAFSEEWAREAEDVYRNYTIYHQSREGTEQAVFDPRSGMPATRSDRLLDALLAEGVLGDSGRLLDVGCGNGTFLRAMSGRLPGWSLAGAEIDDKYKSAVESIPRVERLFSCPLDELPADFDAVIMVHALEHVPHPVRFLEIVRSRLRTGGVLVVEVPDCAQNPFDLLVADHATHFILDSLRQTVAAAGYEIVVLTGGWVPKELTLVARPTLTAPVVAWANTDPAANLAIRNVQWLIDTVRSAREVARTEGVAGRFGLFGSSIAATWLGAELDGDVQFFLDEDPSRQAGMFLERPVYAPSGAPRGSHVYLGLSPIVSRPLAARLRASVPGLFVYEPPPLT